MIGICQTEHIAYDLVLESCFDFCKMSFLRFVVIYFSNFKFIRTLTHWFGSSRSQTFFKMGIFKSFARFTGKHLCFPVNTAKFLRTGSFYRAPPGAASDGCLCHDIHSLKC